MALIASFSSLASTISPSSNNFPRMQLAQSRNLITALLIFITDGLVQARRYCYSAGRTGRPRAGPYFSRNQTSLRGVGRREYAKYVAPLGTGLRCVGLFRDKNTQRNCLSIACCCFFTAPATGTQYRRATPKTYWLILSPVFRQTEAGCRSAQQLPYLSTDLTSQASQSIASLAGFSRRSLLDIVALYYIGETRADFRVCP